MDTNLEAMRRCFHPRQWFQHEGEVDPSVMSEEETFMWVYRKDGDRYEVGYYAPDGQWYADSSYHCRDDAAQRTNYLNGGKCR